MAIFHEELVKLRSSTDWSVIDHRFKLIDNLIYLIEQTIKYNYEKTNNDVRRELLINIQQNFQMEALLNTCVLYKVTRKDEQGVKFIKLMSDMGYRDAPVVDRASNRYVLGRFTTVHYAYKSQAAPEVIRELFKIYDRFDMNYVDERGMTHFHIACQFGFLDVVESFLLKGLDPDNKPHMSPPLYCAAMAGQNEVIELLLQFGADPNYGTAYGLTTLLFICQKATVFRDELAGNFLAICYKHGKLVELDVEDKSGRTALQLAVTRLLPHTAVAILNHGASWAKFVFPAADRFVDEWNVLPDSSLDFRCHLAMNTLEIVDCLIKRGYIFNQSNYDTIVNLLRSFGLFDDSQDLENVDMKIVERLRHVTVSPSITALDLIRLKPHEALTKLQIDIQYTSNLVVFMQNMSNMLALSSGSQ